MNTLEGGRESVMRQPDGGTHVEGEVVVVGVKEWVGTELEASEGDALSGFKDSS